MKAIIRICVALSIFCISFVVKAHKPDLSTTLLVEQGEGAWVLQVRSALTAYEFEIEKHFGKSAYASPEEFQKLVIDYVQKNVVIEANGNKTALLQNGKVKLGHETSATFEVLGMPNDIRSLNVKNSTFSDIARNESGLIIVKKGFAKNQFALENSNNHTAELRVANSTFELVEPEEGQSRSSLVLITAFMSILAVGLLFYMRSKPKKHALAASDFLINTK